MDFTEVFKKTAIAAPKYKVICNYGGSSSSKTISTLQYATIKMIKNANLLTTLTAESLPVIKKTVLKDWKKHVMKGLWQDKRFNKTDMIYTFPSGSQFQFVPADDESRFHGMRQDFALMDEAYNCSKKVFDHLDIRTEYNIFLTWNPTSDFWGRHLDVRSDVKMIHSTYKDNPFVSESIKSSLEMRAQTDREFYLIYVLGQYGTLKGLIFKQGEDWDFTDDFPEHGRVMHGLDFGYTHPTALVRVADWDNKWWLDELIYKSHLVNIGSTHPSIQTELTTLGITHEDIIADSASPTAIRELQGAGYRVYPAIKGKDSIVTGIKLLKSKPMMITRGSINLVKELRNYKWALDKSDNETGKPVDNWNHILDGSRYSTTQLSLARELWVLS